MPASASGACAGVGSYDGGVAPAAVGVGGGPGGKTEGGGPEGSGAAWTRSPSMPQGYSDVSMLNQEWNRDS